MTNRRHNFPLMKAIPHEFKHGGAPAHAVGSISTGNDHGLKVGSAYGFSRRSSRSRHADLAVVFFGPRTNDHYNGTRFFHPVVGIPELKLVVHVLDKDGDAFS